MEELLWSLPSEIFPGSVVKNGFRYFCNGTYVLRVPTDDCDSEINPQTKENLDLLSSWFKGADFSKLWHTIPQSDIDACKKVCRACDGTGLVYVCPECGGDGDLDFETEYNTYTVKCESCDGFGSVKDQGDETQKCEKCEGSGGTWDKRVDYTDGFLRASLASYEVSLLNRLPDLRFGTVPNPDDLPVVPFSFSGGCGFISCTDTEAAL